MPSPLVPLEALLELRRLLDSLHSLQTSDAKCQRTSQVLDTGQTEAPVALASGASAVDESREHENQPNSFHIFNNILR